MPVQIFWASPKIRLHLVPLQKLLCWHKKLCFWMQIIFLSGPKCLWLPQCVNKFLVWHKKFGPAQNILEPVKGQGKSVLSDRRESSEKKGRKAFSLALHILQYHSLFYRDNNYKKEKRGKTRSKKKKNQCYIQWIYKAPLCITLRIKTWVTAYLKFITIF